MCLSPCVMYLEHIIKHIPLPFPVSLENHQYLRVCVYACLCLSEDIPSFQLGLDDSEVGFLEFLVMGLITLVIFMPTYQFLFSVYTIYSHSSSSFYPELCD